MKKQRGREDEAKVRPIHFKLQAVRRAEITGITMTTETNKAVMRRFVEFINTASEKLAQELISPDAVFHVPGRPEPMRGPSGYLEIVGMMRGGFRYSMDNGKGDCRGRQGSRALTMRGTHRGAFFGGLATGKTIVVQAMNFYRLSGGQFLEERDQPDLLGLLQRIGAVPTPRGA